MKFFRTSLIVILLLAFIALNGCFRRSYMKRVPFSKTSYAPEPGKALIIFMHPPYSSGGTKRPTVFDVSSEDENQLVGIITQKTKIAYMAKPGENLFMILSFGNKAKFMKATVEEGKTYYARIIREFDKKTKIRKGFDFRPVHKEDLDSERVSVWLEKCEFVENTEKSDQWAKKNRRSIQAKKLKSIHDWNTRPKKDKEKATLGPQDGR